MKVLITGDRGFIGTHLKKILPDAKGYDLLDGLNILDTDTLSAYIEGADVVIHLAALVSVEQSQREPELYVENNIRGTVSVIENCVKAKVKKLIYASSAACYDPTSSPYALTKYASELFMQSYKDMINTVSLRFFNIYGENQNPTYGAAITAFKKGIENGEITIYGDGKQTRDFIAVEDVCRAIKLSIETDFPSGEVIDIGTGVKTSVVKLAKIMDRLMKKQTLVNYGPARKEVRHSLAKTQKAEKYLKFKSEIDLEKGLMKLL